MSREMNRGRDYKPIIENAKKEESAKGKCRWIIAMLEILAMNHLPHIEKGQIAIKKHVDTSNRKIMILLALVMLVLLATNPQVVTTIVKLFSLF